MSLFTASINSGSNGNCYYIGNSRDAVLIDAGISCRETERRMGRMGLDLKKVRAIFISHEHSDHIKGVEVLSRRYKLPVYITQKTLANSGLKLEAELTRTFSPYTTISFGELDVTAFPKFHDAADPYSFIISHEGINVGVFTDIGIACENVVRNFKQCHAIFLETNYCETMLAEGHYPFYLKRRISSNTGHLSNTQALQLFLEHKPEFMSHLFLSHLSRENNSPALVQKLFNQHCGNTKVVVASRDYETDVFQISSNNDPGIERARLFSGSVSQTSLF